MADTLSFQWLKIPELRNENGGIARQERPYIDFIIGGQSLAQLLDANPIHLIGNFGWGINPTYEMALIQAFLLEKPSELPNGRTMFYVCPECGDIGCGAITGLITETAQHIIWRDFAYENNYAPYDLSEYAFLGPFLFEKTLYKQLMESLKKEIENTLK